MKTVIVGASGLVGSHCLNVFKGHGHNVLGTHINFATPQTVFYNPTAKPGDNFNLQEFNPEIIIHCGALTNVDYCETNVAESETATVVSVKIIAEHCKKNDAQLIYISTDYVFDGQNGPYTEDHPTNPVNVYGKHKLEAEEIVKKVKNHLILRVTNVYGEEARSKNFIARLVLMFQNNEDKLLQLPVDQFATPIYAHDIARMAYTLVTAGKNGIYHLASTDYYTRYHLAQKVKTYFPENESVLLKPIATNKLKQAAKRPLYGGLLNIKFLSEFEDFKLSNIDDFILKIIKNGI